MVAKTQRSKMLILLPIVTLLSLYMATFLRVFEGTCRLFQERRWAGVLGDWSGIPFRLGSKRSAF